MTITIFGATGMIGKELIRHCQAKKYTVIAFGRNVETMIDEDLRDEQFEVIKGSVFSEQDVLHAIKHSDAVLTALGGATDGVDVTRSLGLKNIITQMHKTGIKRIISIGAVGILQADENTLLMDTPDYPQEYMTISREHLKAYQYISTSDLDWTFVCPPNILPIHADGNFITQADYITNGTAVSAGNLAMFMVLELTKNEFVHKRVGISDQSFMRKL